MTSSGAVRGEMRDEAERLAAAARGGRVAFSEFLDPPDADALLASVRALGVQADAWGGFDGAKRRVVTARPDTVPEARPKLTAVYVAGIGEPGSLIGAARAAGVAPGRIGDVVSHEEGVSVVVSAPAPGALLRVRSIEGVPVEPLEVPVDRVAGGSGKEFSAVVPSLRVDVLGAKAFRVSRSYFAKGVAAGRVRVNGAPAGKSAVAQPGDEVYADGLGRFHVERVEGETRRGNVRVTLRVERG